MSHLMDAAQIYEVLDKNLIELMQAQDLSEDQKKEFYETSAKTVQNRVITRIYKELSEEEAAHLDQLTEKGSNTEVQAFLREHNLDLSTLIIEESLVYKMEIIELFKQAQANNNLSNQSSAIQAQ